MKYVSVFQSWATCKQYLKHLRWCPRFLHLGCSWDTPTLKQVLNGLQKSSAAKKVKSVLLSKDVGRIVRCAEGVGDMNTAALAAISRSFLLRVPSEGIPLQWNGNHSRVQFHGDKVEITLMRRKNCDRPTVMERGCSCATSGRSLCAFHWLQRLQLTAETNAVFSLTAQAFVTCVREHALEANVDNPLTITSHAFRRGMAQDIVTHGGTLGELLRAGGWTSRAFLMYLRDSQIHDKAVAEMIIELSDTEVE